MRPEASMWPAWFLSAVCGRPRSRRQHPRIINDRAGKSYRDRRPGPDHRDLPNMVMGERVRLLCERS